MLAVSPQKWFSTAESHSKNDILAPRVCLMSRKFIFSIYAFYDFEKLWDTFYPTWCLSPQIALCDPITTTKHFFHFPTFWDFFSWERYIKTEFFRAAFLDIWFCGSILARPVSGPCFPPYFATLSTTTPEKDVAKTTTASGFPIYAAKKGRKKESSKLLRFPKASEKNISLLALFPCHCAPFR